MEEHIHKLLTKGLLIKNEVMKVDFVGASSALRHPDLNSTDAFSGSSLPPLRPVNNYFTMNIYTINGININDLQLIFIKVLTWQNQ